MMYAGDYITLDFTAKEESGAALNLTGLTLKWSIGRTSDGHPVADEDHWRWDYGY